MSLRQHRLAIHVGVLLCVAMALAMPPTAAEAQTQTVGLFDYDSAASPGYTLFAPMNSEVTYLIDMWGRAVNSWTSDYRPGASVYLLENGDLMRTAQVALGTGGGTGGKLEQYDWDGTLVWEFTYSTADYVQHHDIEPLPNGNFLILAHESKTYAEAIAAGRDPALLGFLGIETEHIVEVQPTGPASGTIVWEWHLWDHLIQDNDPAKDNFGVVGNHPELVNLNYVTNQQTLVDWIHANAVQYNAELDQIIISCRNFHEFWIIDHSTSSAEAAGHTGGSSGMGGDILYRWGNPQAYDAGDASDQQLYGQHDAQWIPDGYPGAGNILVFNNGPNRPGGNHSSVDEIIPPVDGSGDYTQPLPDEPYAPAAPVWSYMDDPPTDWYASNISGAHRLPNGHTLICSGPQGRFLEVTDAGEIVWEYINPVSGGTPITQGQTPANNNVFRCTRYGLDYLGFVGHDLTPESAIELYPATIAGTQFEPSIPPTGDSVYVTATLTSSSAIAAATVDADTGAGYFSVPMADDGLHHDGAAGDDLYGAALPPSYGPQVEFYIVAENGSGGSATDPPNPPATHYWYTVVSTCDCPYQSDGEPDGFVTALDLGSCIDVLYAGSPDITDSGCPSPRFDFDCDGFSTALDLSGLIDHLFAGSAGPCDPCAK